MFRLFFGSPGCGKTTFATYLIYKDRTSKKPKYDYHFTNFECTIARKCDMAGLGTWTFPEYSYAASDESGVDFNARKFKELLKATMDYCKEHRHYKVDIDFFSQSWHDTDLVIRDLAEEVWHLKRLGPFTLARRIKKQVDIDETTHKPEDMYYKLKFIKRFLPFPFNQLSFRIIYRPKYYKFFDTHERKELPVRYFGTVDVDESLYVPIMVKFKQTIALLAQKIKSLVVASVSGVARRVPAQRPASPIGEEQTSDSQKEFEQWQ